MRLAFFFLRRSLSMSYISNTVLPQAENFDLLSQYYRRQGNLGAATFFAKRATERVLQFGRGLRLSNQKLGRHVVALQASILRIWRAIYSIKIA